MRHRLHGGRRASALLILIAAASSAFAAVLPWATTGTAGVTVANAGDNGTRCALIFVLAAVALAFSAAGGQPWAPWVGLAMGPPLAIASYLAFTGAEAALLAAGAPQAAIRVDLGAFCGTAAAIVAFAGGLGGAIVRRRSEDGGEGGDGGDGGDRGDGGDGGDRGGRDSGRSGRPATWQQG